MLIAHHHRRRAEACADRRRRSGQPAGGWPTLRSTRMTPAGPAAFVTVMRQRAAGIGHHSCDRLQIVSRPAARHLLDAPWRVSTPTPAMPGMTASTAASVPFATTMLLWRTTPAGCRTQTVRRARPAVTATRTSAGGEVRATGTGACIVDAY